VVYVHIPIRGMQGQTLPQPRHRSPKRLPATGARIPPPRLQAATPSVTTTEVAGGRSPLPADGAGAGGPAAGGPPRRGGRARPPGGGDHARWAGAITPAGRGRSRPLGGGDEGGPEGSVRPQDGNLIGHHNGTIDWHVGQACQQARRAWNGVQCSP